MSLVETILTALTIRMLIGSFFILACCYLGFAITLYITKKR